MIRAKNMYHFAFAYTIMVARSIAIQYSTLARFTKIFHSSLTLYYSSALVDDSTLLIGSVDQIQMLHIQTIPLGETPRYMYIYVELYFQIG